jgi:hypothetical protein
MAAGLRGSGACVRVTNPTTNFMPMESEMLAYRYNAPSVYTPRVAVIDLSLPVTKRKRYDWDFAKARAERGIIPAAPRFPETTLCLHRYQGMLEEIVRTARAGDIRGLKELDFPLYNNRWRLISRYRDLCVKALLRSNFRR